ncbi:MAG: hypothetical protein WA964_02450 [Ilumatobacter sp.]|uniref:hypothetical protein n=1 Tax=Ilumatobacter sp. TaxID=1967498 RepID=UPI003C7226EC
MKPCATSNVPAELVAALTANGCTEVFFGHSALEYPAAMMGGVTGMDDTDALFADALVSMIREMSDDELHNVAEIVRQVQIERAVGNGDEDAIIANAFEMAFGRDGLAVLPWVEGNVVVCPGGMVSKSKASHKCRFVSVDDTWIWESHLLLREDKRSSPGTDEGFRAVALLPLVDGIGIDVVSGKARQGQHSVDHVVSYEIRGGELVEVSQRTVRQRH